MEYNPESQILINTNTKKSKNNTNPISLSKCLILYFPTSIWWYWTKLDHFTISSCLFYYPVFFSLCSSIRPSEMGIRVALLSFFLFIRPTIISSCSSSVRFVPLKTGSILVALEMSSYYRKTHNHKHKQILPSLRTIFLSLFLTLFFFSNLLFCNFHPSPSQDGNAVGRREMEEFSKPLGNADACLHV